MKKTSIKKWVSGVVLLVAVFLSGCSKDEPKDSMSPLAVFSSPMEGAVYQRGQSLILSGTITDDKELSHIDVSIATLKSSSGYNDPWISEEKIALSGREKNINSYALFEQAIPFDIMSGNYTINILVVDKALNYSSYPIAITIQ